MLFHLCSNSQWLAAFTQMNCEVFVAEASENWTEAAWSAMSPRRSIFNDVTGSFISTGLHPQEAYWTFSASLLFQAPLTDKINTTLSVPPYRKQFFGWFYFKGAIVVGRWKVWINCFLAKIRSSLLVHSLCYCLNLTVSSFETKPAKDKMLPVFPEIVNFVSHIKCTHMYFHPPPRLQLTSERHSLFGSLLCKSVGQRSEPHFREIVWMKFLFYIYLYWNNVIKWSSLAS